MRKYIPSKEMRREAMVEQESTSRAITLRSLDRGSLGYR
jgi:hypothetical protein